MAEYIQTLKQIIEIAQSHEGYWFRGQCAPHSTLRPKVFRDSGQILNALGSYEHAVVSYYRRHAPAVYTSCPSANDHLEWLYLMQHFGCPTRLLDWTENVLVALFFAVDGSPGEDGQLWIMSPLTLNALTDRPSLNTPILEDRAHAMAAEPFQEGKPPEKLRKPIALQPPLRFPRMQVQASAFTIHSANHEVNDLARLLGDEPDGIESYSILAASKNALRYELSAIGVSKRTLFPGLESLSEAAHEEALSFLHRGIVRDVWKKQALGMAEVNREAGQAGGQQDNEVSR